MRCTGDGDHGVHRHLGLTSSPGPRPARPQFERAHVRIAVGPQWRRETPSESGTGAGQHPAVCYPPPPSRLGHGVLSRIGSDSSWLGPRLRHGPSMPWLPSASRPAGPSDPTGPSDQSPVVSQSTVRVVRLQFAYTQHILGALDRDPRAIMNCMHW